MGDCKNFDAQFYNALKNKEFFNVKNGGSEMNNSNFRKANNQSGRAGFDLTKCGMVFKLEILQLLLLNGWTLVIKKALILLSSDL